MCGVRILVTIACVRTGARVSILFPLQFILARVLQRGFTPLLDQEENLKLNARSFKISICFVQMFFVVSAERFSPRHIVKSTTPSVHFDCEQISQRTWGDSSPSHVRHLCCFYDRIYHVSHRFRWFGSISPGWSLLSFIFRYILYKMVANKSFFCEISAPTIQWKTCGWSIEWWSNSSELKQWTFGSMFQFLRVKNLCVDAAYKG